MRTRVAARWRGIRGRPGHPQRLPGVSGLHVVVAGLAEAREAVLAGADILRLSVDAERASPHEAGRGMRELGTWFCVADDLDVALELGADGVHLDRRRDLADAARRTGLRVGVTLDGAAPAGVDYVEFGRVGESIGGDGALTSWLVGLARAVADAAVPVVASGEIDVANAEACLAAGATGIAVRHSSSGPQLRRLLDAALEARAASRGQR